MIVAKGMMRDIHDSTRLWKKKQNRRWKCILNLSKSKHILDAIRDILTSLFLIFLFFFPNRVQKRWHHKKLFLYFSVLDTMYQCSMMKNIHSQNLVGIGSRRPKIWLHEYPISPIEISVNWPGSKQLTRPIYTDFNGLIRYSWRHISGYHEPIHVKFGVRGFLPCSMKYCHENAEMQKRKFDDVTLQYSIGHLHISHIASWWEAKYGYFNSVCNCTV